MEIFFYGFRLITSAAELLLKARDLKALNEPSNRDYTSVLRFMENSGGQLYEEESDFIYGKEDLITIRPGREYAWLDGFIERLLQICRCRIMARPLRVGDIVRLCDYYR